MSEVTSPILKKIPSTHFIASLTSQLRLQSQNMLIARAAQDPFEKQDRFDHHISNTKSIFSKFKYHLFQQLILKGDKHSIVKKVETKAIQIYVTIDNKQETGTYKEFVGPRVEQFLYTV